MKERPILFSGAMVRAILSGAKTQTRRIVKPQPLLVNGGRTYTWPDSIGSKASWDARIANPACLLPSPYGQPGDRLAVRETWCYCGWTEDGLPFVEYQADGSARLCDRGISEEWAEKLMGIWADLSATQNFELDGRAADRCWRPSIHMPRWASRLTLEITGVRVERLQAISEADARAEGCDGNCPIGHLPAYLKGPLSYHYAQLWESINGLGSWEANPWVWVVEFRRIGQSMIAEGAK